MPSRDSRHAASRPVAAAVALLTVLGTVSLGTSSADDRVRVDVGDTPALERALEAEKIRFARERAERATPAARERRERSRTAFAGQTAAEAVDLARSRFANAYVLGTIRRDIRAGNFP